MSEDPPIIPSHEEPEALKTHGFANFFRRHKRGIIATGAAVTIAGSGVVAASNMGETQPGQDGNSAPSGQEASTNSTEATTTTTTPAETTSTAPTTVETSPATDSSSSSGAQVDAPGIFRVETTEDHAVNSIAPDGPVTVGGPGTSTIAETPEGATAPTEPTPPIPNLDPYPDSTNTHGGANGPLHQVTKILAPRAQIAKYGYYVYFHP